LPLALAERAAEPGSDDCALLRTPLPVPLPPALSLLVCRSSDSSTRCSIEPPPVCGGATCGGTMMSARSEMLGLRMRLRRAAAAAAACAPTVLSADALSATTG